ncbi:MAG: RHS repeat-associated core domain-containing protein [Bacilli bacterium]|nr:RHS repeat-associated core domain-containing protein [Bacilli bacterium]
MSFYFAGYYFDKYKQFLKYDYKDYSFKVDLEYGKLYFTRKLFALPGRHLPLDLSLKYIEPHTASTGYLHYATGFPKGCKTNYHVFLEYDSSNDKYNYEDSDGFLHVFIKAINSSSLYYDSNGSGLMLETIQSGGYKIFDDYGNYQQFDIYGRLILIHQHITSSLSAEVSISYLIDGANGSLKIDHISDNYGRTVYFAYYYDHVEIYFNNNLVSTVLFNSDYYLTKVTKNIGDNNIIEENFTCSPLLDELELDNGDTFTIHYYDDKVSILSSSLNHVRYAFDYHYGENKVTVKDAHGINTLYDFNQEQLVSQKLQGSGNLSYFTLSSEFANCLIKDINDNQIIHFYLNNSSQQSSHDYDMPYNESFHQSIVNENSNIQSEKIYLFYARIYGQFANNDTLTVELKDYDGNSLAMLDFKKGTSLLASPVGVKHSTQRKFYITITKNFQNSVLIEEVKLVPLIGEFEAFCSNVRTDGPVFFYGDTPYYFLSNGKGVFLNGSSYMQYYHCFMDDYLANERLFWTNSSGSNHFWFDNFTKLMDNVTSLTINMRNYLNMNWSNSPKSIKYAGPGTSADVSFYKINAKDDATIEVTRISHNNQSFPSGNTSFFYEKEAIKHLSSTNSYSYINDYDENYLLQKVTRSDSYVEEYTYDNRGNLLEETINSGSLLDYFNIENAYDNQNEDKLISSAALVGTSVSTKTYSYNSLKRHNITTYPNGLIETTNYDDITSEREKSLRFTSSSTDYIDQFNNYIDEETYELATDSDVYTINTVHGEVGEIKNNNQTILEIEYVPNIHQDIVMNYRYYRYYANGYETYTSYDNLNRPQQDEYLEFEYDDFNNPISINDNTITQLDPNLSPYITNEFDYYNQLISTEVDYNGLSVSYEYEKNRRLVEMTIASLYYISYVYYPNNGLEKSIKKSTIAYGGSFIEVDNEADIYSRVYQESLLVNNSGFKKKIEYCRSSTETNRSNNYPKTVLYYDVNNNTPTLSMSRTYSYNSVGNITAVSTLVGNVTYLVTYVYDKYSRLLAESNQFLSLMMAYAYDNNGNIRSRNIYYCNSGLPNPGQLIATFTYSYNDPNHPNRLTSYNNQSIQYDNYGNPTVYRNHNLTWTRGTLLETYQVSNSVTVSFKYDGFKQRILKSISPTNYTMYNYINGTLISEVRNNVGTLLYLNSHNGVIGFVFNNQVYYYEKDIQQDVIAIRNSSFQVVAKYIYDAWGNHKVLNPNGTENTNPSFIGNINPIRYRSYYCDTDLRLYWLTSRYYDSETGRFISPDDCSYLDYKKINGLNLYAYSKNNPVMYYDPSGHVVLELLLHYFFFVKPVVDTTDTIVDIILLTSDTVKQSDSDYGHIENSALIKTPWVKYGYLVHLAFTGRPATSGSLLGAVFEWECHNLAWGFMQSISFLGFGIDSNKIDSALSVDLGKSIFSDSGHGVFGVLMKITYIRYSVMTCRALGILLDLIIGGWGNDWE